MTDCDCYHLLDRHIDREILASPDQRARALRSELRAVEEGHRAIQISTQPGSRIQRYRVVSNCRHGVSYVVTAYLRPTHGSPAVAFCPCPGGRVGSSRYPVPCKHTALVMRSLERQNLVRWEDGLWWAPGQRAIHQARQERSATMPDDPFDDLAPPPMEEELL